ncbi:MAG: DUF4331 domain-containing protein [Mycobacteriales bacterium]
MSLSRPSGGRRRATAAFAASATALVGAAALLGPGVSNASSHREAPITAGDPAIDNTDVYAFTSPDKPDTVTLIANFIPFQLPAGGPNFYPFSNDVRYNIKVNTTGDAKAQLTYRFTFTRGPTNKDTFLYNTGAVNSIDDATLNVKQNYKVELVDATGAVKATLVANGKVAPSNVGAASMPNYAMLRDQSLASGVGTDGTKTFAGQADDPFFLDLRVFDLLYGTNLKEAGNPTLSGLNVNSIAVQVPKAVLTAAAAPDTSKVIGVYATAERQSSIAIKADGTRTSSGDWVQVSRLGNPLVNEVVASVGLKDAFNSLPPEKDATVDALVARVTDPEVPKLIEKIYGIKAPATPRDDLKTIFLTGVKGLNQPTNPTPAELLRLNIDTPVAANPNRLGLLAGDKQGFPNGRRLTDDVVDIEVQALEGAFKDAVNGGQVNIVQALAAGDGVNSNDVAFGQAFPYLALPHSGSTPGNGSLGGGTTSGTTGSTGGSTGSSSGSTGSSSGSSSGSGTSGTSGTTSSMPKGGVATGAGGTASVSHTEPLVPISVALLGVLFAGIGVVTLRRSRV